MRIEWECCKDSMEASITPHILCDYAKVGDLLTIVDTSYGAGGVERGDFGVVKMIVEGEGYVLDIPSKGLSDWLCKFKDVDFIFKPEELFKGVAGKKLELAEELLRASVLDKVRIPFSRTVLSQENTRLVDTVLSTIRSLEADESTATFNRAPQGFDLDSLKKNAKSIIGLVDKIEKIEYKMSGIVVTTAPIIIKWSDEGRFTPVKVDMGRYRIFITSNNRIVIFSLDKNSDNCDHPHIRGGSCCFGSYQDALRKIFAKNYLLGELLTILFDYLESCTRSGWYQAIDNWIPDMKDRCGVCYQLRESCECKTKLCAKCSKSAVECNCWVCPLSGLKIGQKDKCFDCVLFSRSKEKCIIESIERQIRRKFDIKKLSIDREEVILLNKEIEQEKDSIMQTVLKTRDSLLGGLK